jgi:hypothetical protein
LSAIGLVPMSAAIAGRDVAITVESMFSMNRATARISGVRRINCGTGRRGRNAGLFAMILTVCRGKRKCGSRTFVTSLLPLTGRGKC